MDAPMCKLCEKRHYGPCFSPVVAEEPRARKTAKQPAKLHRATRGLLPAAASDPGPEKKLTTDGRPIVEHPVPDWQRIEEILARLESLEFRVLELESRKRYMREYQRRKRAEEKEGV